MKKFVFEILVSKYLEYSKTSRNVIFSWRPDVCACVRVCVCASVCMCPIFNVCNLDNSQDINTSWDINMKFGTPVKQSQPFNRDYFHDN